MTAGLPPIITGAPFASNCGVTSIPVTCRSDNNEDGVVDIIDLITLLQDWGPCE